MSMGDCPGKLLGDLKHGWGEGVVGCEWFAARLVGWL